MANSLSDFNEFNSVSEQTADAKVFSDLNLIMNVHPARKDIIPLTDIDAIKQAVKNLVLTNRGERPFMHNVGGDITRLLFENYNPYMAAELSFAIENVLEQHEPRVSDIEIQVTPTDDQNSIAATIGFRINNQYREFNLEFALNRLR
jgi:phage baseplate assembly protein W